jgi:hypothetical protein
MVASVNVDLETRNNPGGDPDCLAHPNAGPHFDITVHPDQCRHHDPSRRADPPKRYWKDLPSAQSARQFADDEAA